MILRLVILRLACAAALAAPIVLGPVPARAEPRSCQIRIVDDPGFGLTMDRIGRSCAPGDTLSVVVVFGEIPDWLPARVCDPLQGMQVTRRELACAFAGPRPGISATV
ncbi:MAG TPA: hypothetical protein VGC80_10725 [Acetobacteraceae bacterium]|jgi:hypothetical protein